MIDAERVKALLGSADVPADWYWISNDGFYKPGYVNLVFIEGIYHVVLWDGRKSDIDKKFKTATAAQDYFIRVLKGSTF